MDALTKTGWILYQVLANLVGPPAAAAAGLSGRFSGRWSERLGLADHPGQVGDDLFWFHAASVGETRSAAVVIQNLLEFNPAVQVALSVGTPAGLDTAETLFKNCDSVSVMAAPYDFWASPARTVKALQPKALIIWETELWPNLIA